MNNNYSSEKEKKRPLVSIVTSTFNSEKTIRKTMESVLNQTYPRIEYIIADGDSHDNTLNIVGEYTELFREKGYTLQIITGKDTGIYAGMNKGIKQASGEIIGIVNSDDFYEKSIVSSAVNAYLKTNFDLLYSYLNIVDKNEKVLRVKKARRMQHFYTTRNWNHPTMFVPKRIYDVRMYDEQFQYYGDWEFVLWVFKHYSNIVVLKKPLSNFRLGGITTHQNLKILNKKFIERFRGYRGNGYSPLYVFECVFMDYGKETVMRILGK